MKGIEVGLTGGIGSGKSTVAEFLAGLGAALVDADKIVRQMQEPGQPVYKKMVEHFGEGFLLADGSLDRKAIAEVVFNDPKELDKLNKMVHPPLQAEMERLRGEYLAAGEKVIVDFPLLAESSYRGFEAVIVVDCDVETAVRRLVEGRGFSEEDARARIANQAPRDERVKLADFLIENSGDLTELESRVKECWEWICGLKPA